MGRSTGACGVLGPRVGAQYQQQAKKDRSGKSLLCGGPREAWSEPLSGVVRAGLRVGHSGQRGRGRQRVYRPQDA